ncbi:S8 family serine peptidase [Actinoplanes sp. NPDC049548]|uniref:S8 family serine peptidase n=1 Tax=Actinoplanes sp. NPDC049548 TaxID=3155152 RepID=UPI00341A0158
MRVFTRRRLTAVIAGGVIVLGAGSPARAADGTTADTFATVVDAAGRPTFVEVEAATVAQEVRRAESLPGSVGASFATTASVAAVSDDTYRDYLWNNDALHIDDISPRPTVAGQIVAVLDTGVSPAEEDWAPGQVRCDLGTDLVLDGYTTASGGNGCVDPHGHGTHVAGTIGAVAGNAVGMAGIASGVQIMPVRVLNASGSGWDVTIAQGIVWAVDHGATVINMSLSGPQSANYDEAVAYATSNDVPIVVANGNNRQLGNAPVWPASVPGVIAVAATDYEGASGSFSNSSGTALIAAPGVSILSMDATHANADFPYTFKSGTSMASPHVAAAVALWRAAHPQGTPADVRSALTSTAIDAGAPGFDNEFGYGVVNVYRLVTGADWGVIPPSLEPEVTPTPTPTPTETVPAPVETTPAPIETTPAPIETTPAPIVAPPAPVVTPAPVAPLPAPAPELKLSPVAPAAPAAVKITALTEALRVSWPAVTGTANAPVSGYRLYRNGTLRATLTGTSFTDRVAGGAGYTYSVAAYGPGGTSPQVSAKGSARWASAGLTLSRTSVVRKMRLVVRGTSLRPGSTLTVRETYAYRKSSRTVVLASVRVSAGDDVSVWVLPVQSARTGTLTVQGVDHDGDVVRVSRSIRVG